MTECRYVVGDTAKVLAQLPDESVDLVMTSPPFLALRSYLPADHPQKAEEIGSEATPAEFLDVLLELTAEWGRVLAPHGSICVELGDTYAGSGGAGGDYTDTGLRAGQEKFSGSALQHRRSAIRNRDQTAGWPLAKSLCMIPQLYAASLAYGRNLLTGEESPAGVWRVRNVVAWCRPNPPVGALGDKYRPSTSYLTVATKAKDRWFDLDAVRTAGTEPGAVKRHSTHAPNGRQGWGANNAEIHQNPAGAPPLDHWIIPTRPYSGSHYAVYPPELCRIPIESMCPRQVCDVCGQPSRRIVEATGDYASKLGSTIAGRSGKAKDAGLRGSTQPPGDHITSAEYDTLGWTDCGHDAWRNGRVLDPFGGSGTTGMVATGLGRDALLIDLDERNLDLARERVGPLLLAENTAEQAADWLTGRITAGAVS